MKRADLFLAREGGLCYLVLANLKTVAHHEYFVCYEQKYQEITYALAESIKQWFSKEIK